MLNTIQSQFQALENSYYFEKISTEVKKHTKVIVVAIVCLSAIALIYTFIKKGKNSSSEDFSDDQISDSLNNLKIKPKNKTKDPLKGLKSFITNGKNKGNDDLSNKKGVSTSTSLVKQTPALDGGVSHLSASNFDKIDKVCGEISEKIYNDSTYSAVVALEKVISPELKEEILNLLNEAVERFENEFNPEIKFDCGTKVENYFANNQQSSTVDERKYYSLLGIRNLLLFGPEIFDDFRDTNFLGGKHHYDKSSQENPHGKGLRKFHYYTGTVVDLDVEFLASNDQEAIKIAQREIVKFGKKCGIVKPAQDVKALSMDEVEKYYLEIQKKLPNRKLDLLDNGKIHVSADQNDRSNFGIWKHNNSYFANVPYSDVNDVDALLIATIRIPYLLAELVYLTKKHIESHPTQDMGKNLFDEFYKKFFQEGLTDQCFNHKANALVAFNTSWKDKLNELEGNGFDPKKIARDKIENGSFGQIFKDMGADNVLKEALTPDKLITLYEKKEANFALKIDETSKEIEDFDTWKKKHGDVIIEMFKNDSLLETRLYQVSEDDVYAIFDQKTAEKYLKRYYDYLLYC